MNDLERIKAWLTTYSGYDRLQRVTVDYLSSDPNTGSITPSGLVELSRVENMMGSVLVENQYCFGLYFVMAKTTGDDTNAVENAAWILGLQQWVQEQSIRRLAPTFGDEPATERMYAQNGVLYTDNNNGTATYRVELTATFKKYYEVI